MLAVACILRGHPLPVGRRHEVPVRRQVVLHVAPAFRLRKAFEIATSLFTERFDDSLPVHRRRPLLVDLDVLVGADVSLLHQDDSCGPPLLRNG
jgi:hypothetical protein